MTTDKQEMEREKEDRRKIFMRLRELVGNIESEPFQTLIMKPLFAELEKVKNAYDCKTLTELATVKGKKNGILFLINLLKSVKTQYENAKTDVEELENRTL